VVSYDLDRLLRDPFEAEQFWLLCEQAGMYRVLTVADDVDISTGHGLLVARIKAAVAAEEVRKIRQRVKDKHDELREAGKNSGGQPGYGYYQTNNTGPLLVNRKEAKIVQEIAKRILRGESLGSIGGDLTRRKVSTSRGGRWGSTVLISVVTKPQVAGLRIDKDGKPQRAAWEPILERKQWDKLRTLLGKDRTVTGKDGMPHPATVKRHRLVQRNLLSGGIAVCGLCGARMVVQTARPRPDRKSIKRASYTCPQEDRGGCSDSVSILKDDLDTWVTELVQVAFLDTKVGKALARQKDDPRSPLLEEIGRLQSEIDGFDTLRGQNKISHRRWHNVTQGLEAQLKAAESKLRSLPMDGVTIGTSANAILDEWDTYSIAQKQRVIRLLFSEVRVFPANHPDVLKREARKLKLTGNRRTFDPRRIKFVPATDKVDDKVIAQLIEAVAG
jgi:site-specific DNA recombinase